MTEETVTVGGSFRDPSGFVFRRDGEIYRQVNRCFAADYDYLVSVGLYDHLSELGLLLPHQEVDAAPAEPATCHRTLRPERLDFVSYPYEWCFGQLQDAALTTLRIEREALSKGATLRDASSYNIQFQRGRPVLIDTLSLGRHSEGEPWVAYRQFCQHFLAPLALMSQRDVRLGQLLRVHLDGIALDLASKLLPWRARLRPGLFLHLTLHARYQRRYAARGEEALAKRRRMSTASLDALLQGLERTVAKLHWAPEGTTWADYSSGDSYGPEALAQKQAMVREQLQEIAPRTVWDLGANTGAYSRIAAELGSQVLSFDVDPGAVEHNYRSVREAREERVLPLLLDLANPSPGLGWAHQERTSLLERRGADALLVLALVHHLAIVHNVPLGRMAAFFAGLAPRIVVEFVPKQDPKVRTLLATREDVFPAYSREGFEKAFRERFEIEALAEIPGSARVLYRMRRRGIPGQW
jgi:hypothetical protein